MEKGKAFRLLKILLGGLIVVLAIFLSWHYIKRPERAMAPADNSPEQRAQYKKDIEQYLGRCSLPRAEA
jgi:hypothetical protein